MKIMILLLGTRDVVGDSSSSCSSLCWLFTELLLSIVAIGVVLSHVNMYF